MFAISRKTIIYLLVLIMVLSLGFNYYLYQQNKGFKISIGSDYLGTVRKTLFELEIPTDFWITELNTEDGDVALKRYKGELESLASQFTEIEGSISILGEQLRKLSDLYAELERAIENNEDAENISEIKEEIAAYKLFLTEVLSEVENDFGEDNLVWYRELSDSDSETSTRIWNAFKAFEEQQKEF